MKIFKIAIIDDDTDYIRAFARFFKKFNVKITEFISKEQVTPEVMNEFDMIYVDYNLPWTRGDELIDVLSQHTTADFSLISADREQFSKENINNTRITAIITKWNKEYILEWFHYIKEKRNNLYPHG